MRCWRSSFITATVVGLLSQQAFAAPRTASLPLSRVRLYETGVGYFERSGSVPSGETALPVPAGHLDDALKTLVVLGGDTMVSGVAFASSVSRDMARRLAGLPEHGEEALSFSELSRTFKGAGVTVVTAAGQYSGKLVDALEGLRRRFAMTELVSGQLREFAAIETTNPAQRAVLLRAAERLLAAEKRLGAKPKRQAELDQSLADVARVS